MRVEEIFTQGPVMLVAAHPDDETIGAGAMLARMQRVTVVHVTDGAPRLPSDAIAAGYPSREDYALARRRELVNALEVAGIRSETTVSLNFIDQEASLELAYTSLHLLDLFRKKRPAVVFTHPYEGGHPDHDAVAFSVHAACALAEPAPAVYEFTSYHAAAPEAAAQMETGRFLEGQDAGEVLVLSEEDRARKRTMTECFTTQVHMLRHFSIDAERYRPAPLYDFAMAPHAGPLFYENFAWGMNGGRWRDLAAGALKNLGLPSLL